MKFLNSLEYFIKTAEEPFFMVSEILDNPQHTIYPAVYTDLNNLTEDELDEFSKKHHKYLDLRINPEFEKKKWCLINLLQDYLAISKNKLLTTKEAGISVPYNNTDFTNIHIDKHNMVNILDLDQLRGGLAVNEHVYRLCPVLANLNSSYWLFNLIINESYSNKRNFKIRLDPLTRIHKEYYNPMFYMMNVYGVKLDWVRLSQLRDEDHGEFLADEASSSSIGVTQYTWTPSTYEVHFTCEELPKKEKLTTRGSRYFHAIFDKKTGCIIHCDGALRFYTSEEFELRGQYHIRKSEVRKIGRRVKVFQIDEEIDQQLFMDLATTFFVWNHDVLKYFQ